MKKIKFLKLHSADDNSVLIANSKEIIYINTDPDSEDKKTTIATYSDDEERVVNETPDKIYAHLENYGFVRCHRKADNSVELFNINYFIVCSTDEDGDTIVYLSNSIEMCVNETPERIYNAIIQAQTLYNREDVENVVVKKKTQQNQNKEQKQ